MFVLIAALVTNARIAFARRVRIQVPRGVTPPPVSCSCWVKPFHVALVCTNDQLAAVKIRNTVTQAPASTIQSMHQAYQTVQSVSRPRRRTGPAPDMDRSPEHSLAHRG